MRKRKVYIETVEEFNEILNQANRCSNLVECTYEQLKEVYKVSLSTHSCYSDNQVNVEITTQFYNLKSGKGFKPTTYVFRKDGDYKVVSDGADCYMLSQRYYKVPNYREEKEIVESLGGFTDKGSFKASARPLVGYSTKFNNTEHDVYIYDLNSAYAVQLMDKLPNTMVYYMYKRLHENQVGFMFDEQLTMITQPGMYADIVFDLIDSPLKGFARKYYDMKRYAKNKHEKLKAKNMLNLTVGYWQRTNPFLRAYVVHSCNNFIKSLIDENTCMWNTDAIYSIVPRPDLELGNDIGQFKLEYQGLFRQKGDNYQKVSKEDTSYRGIPKKWFSTDWNILKDEIPRTGNIYRLDKDLMQLVEVEY